MRSGQQNGVTAGILRGLVEAGGQSALTLAVMGSTGLVICIAAGSYDGIPSMIGWLMLSAAAAFVTTVIVMVGGLPLRLIPRARNFWWAHAGLAFVWMSAGAVLIVGSLVLAARTAISDDFGGRFDVLEPNPWILLAGWLLLAFSCAHVRWPRRWSRRRAAGSSVRL
ncbi:hypothetical protein [Leifsonia sp. 1010]|uniref:hypothetical protein n=1 Tax=Leifsonia sp. 1010 TaxID=2817769 RepID=UPI002867063F|nr:hypothetical protein [Leifsonia sp. 1010]MDR6614090.1 hypothetical protein [Leifsonia sp. 1010]